MVMAFIQFCIASVYWQLNYFSRNHENLLYYETHVYFLSEMHISITEGICTGFPIQTMLKKVIYMV